jgi:hypothetical protein
MVWTKDTIQRALRRQYRAKADLSYNSMAKQMQSLVSAAAYHFGSYRNAVVKAGINYDDIVRRPRWTKAMIIQLIKQARRKHEDLNWSSASKRRDELGRAAFAALQPRLFGSWARALTAAGLDADDVSMYRKWNKDAILVELRSRYKNHEPLNSGALQREDPGLHAAAVRHISSYDTALRSARLEPESLRQRQHWDKPAVVKALKTAKKAGKHLSDSAIRAEMPALYGAAVRLFGSFTTARESAGIAWNRNKR